MDADLLFMTAQAITILFSAAGPAHVILLEVSTMRFPTIWYGPVSTSRNDRAHAMMSFTVHRPPVAGKDVILRAYVYACLP